MTCGFITINKTKQKQANVYSGGRWKLINSAGEPVHKDCIEIPETVVLVIN